jgi:uncharacterized spore protein YtfJ
MGVHQILEPLLERLHVDANIKTIYGEPIEVEGKTIIPVAKMMYGLGGGFGKAKTTNREGYKEEKLAGESGGGGIRIMLMGVIEVSREKTHFVSLNNKKVSLLIAVLIAFLVGLILGRFLFGS